MKCKVCGKRFPLRAKNRYVVSTMESIFAPPVHYNAFDCPHCGCQNIVGVVEMNVVDENKDAGVRYAVNNAHWIDNHNGTISCSHCHTWFNKDGRYSYMRYCPYCCERMVDPQEGEEKE